MSCFGVLTSSWRFCPGETRRKSQRKSREGNLIRVRCPNTELNARVRMPPDSSASSPMKRDLERCMPKSFCIATCVRLSRHRCWTCYWTVLAESPGDGTALFEILLSGFFAPCLTMLNLCSTVLKVVIFANNGYREEDGC